MSQALTNERAQELSESEIDHELRCAAVHRAIQAKLDDVDEEADSFALNIEESTSAARRYWADIAFRRDTTKTIVIEFNRAQVEQLLALDADTISMVVAVEQELTEIVEDDVWQGPDTIDITEAHTAFTKAAKHFVGHRVSCDGRVWVDERYGVQALHGKSTYRVLDVDGMPVGGEASLDEALRRIEDMIKSDAD